MCSMCVPNTCEGQKRASDHLELESQVAVSHREGAENRTCACCESSQCPELLSVSPATMPQFLFKDGLLQRLAFRGVSGQVTFLLEM